MITTLERLAAIEDIRQVKARYWRSMDRRDWDAYESCFTDDCVFDVSLSFIEPEIGRMPTPDHPAADKSLIFVGAKAIRNFVEQLLAGVRSVHQGHLAEIELESPDVARAIFPFEDILDFPEGASPRHVHGHGHYHETYRRLDGRWYIAELTIHRLRVKTTDADFL